MNEKIKAVADAMLRGWEMVGHRKSDHKLFVKDMDGELRACALGCVALGCGMEPDPNLELSSEPVASQMYASIIACAAGGDGYIELDRYQLPDYYNTNYLFEFIWRKNDPGYNWDGRNPDQIAEELYEIAEATDAD